MTMPLSSTSVGTVQAGLISRYSGRRLPDFFNPQLERQPLFRQDKTDFAGIGRKREVVEGTHGRVMAFESSAFEKGKIACVADRCNVINPGSSLGSRL